MSSDDETPAWHFVGETDAYALFGHHAKCGPIMGTRCQGCDTTLSEWVAAENARVDLELVCRGVTLERAAP